MRRVVRSGLLLAATFAALSLFGQAVHGQPAPGSIWRHTGAACNGTSCPGWEKLDNNPATVNIAAAGMRGSTPPTRLYQLQNSGRIFRFTGKPCLDESCTGWEMLDNHPQSIGIFATGDQFYQLRRDGKVLRFTDSVCNGKSCPGWQMLDNNSGTLTLAVGGGSLYQLQKDGRILRHMGPTCTGGNCFGWQMLDNNPASVRIAAGISGLVQLRDDGRILRFTGTPCDEETCAGWQMLDNNPATIGIAVARSGIFQLQSNGRILRFTGRPCNGETCSGWQMLDNNPATIGIVAGSRQSAQNGDVLYQILENGLVFRFTGMACQGSSCRGWSIVDTDSGTGRIVYGSSGDSLFKLHARRQRMTRERTCAECRIP